VSLIKLPVKGRSLGKDPRKSPEKGSQGEWGNLLSWQKARPVSYRSEDNSATTTERGELTLDLKDGVIRSALAWEGIEKYALSTERLLLPGRKKHPIDLSFRKCKKPNQELKRENPTIENQKGKDRVADTFLITGTKKELKRAEGRG